MVLFDKGGNVLKSAEFHKEVTEWLYQEKNAADFANRAEAVVALSNIKNDDRVTMAIGEALRTDRALGIRILAADALGDIGTSAAAKEILAALEKSEDPWVRSHIVGLLVNFKGNAAVAAKLAVVVREDKSYRARANALGVIGSLKLPNAFDILLQALDTSSPDDILRNSALRGLGMLEDDRALPMLLDWSTPGRPISARSAAIWSMGRMDKNNHEITRRIAEYLTDPHYAVQVDAISALGDRGDQEAIKAFEPLLQVGEIGIRVEQMIRQQLLRLKSSQAGVGGQQRAEDLQR